jgi:hypothetical protein
MVRRRNELQALVVRRSRHEEGRGAPPVRRFRSTVLRSLLAAGETFVSLVEHDGELFAVVTTCRATRLQPLGDADAVRLEAGRLRTACARAFTATDSANRAAHRDVAALSAERFEHMVFGKIRLGDGRVVLNPTSSLHAAPWGCLPNLRIRSFVVTPSASTWMTTGSSGGVGPPTLVAGPGLVHADAEIERLAVLYPTAVIMSGSGARCSDVLGHLDGSPMAHFACHGSFAADHPMLSGLELADGRLTAYDIERLEKPPPVFVISACQAGLSAARPGDELLGFTAALIGIGVTSVVASAIPVPDDERTLRVIEVLHRHLAAGADAPDALRASRMASDTDAMVAGAFTCFGRRSGSES